MVAAISPTPALVWNMNISCVYIKSSQFFTVGGEACFLLTCTTYIKYTLHVLRCWKIVDEIAAAASSYLGFNELILNWSYDKCYLRISWRHHLSFSLGAIYSLDFYFPLALLVIAFKPIWIWKRNHWLSSMSTIAQN